MQRVQDCADQSIRRGCGFGFLAVATAMVGMSSEMALAMKMGAIGTSLMAAILVLKGLNAPRRNFKHTEVWILLDRRHNFPDGRAQAVIGNILRERYLWHATWVASAAVTLWLVSFLLNVLK
jgi:hypothetical protein